MDNEDDILQGCLNTLEKGSQLQEVLDELPEGSEEMASLIQLAAAVRGLPHPEPLRVRARARKRALLNAVVETTRPIPPGMLRERLSTNGHGPKRNKPRPAFPLLLSFLGISAVAFFLVALVGMVGFGVWLVAGPHNVQEATLVDVQGQVEVAAADGASWRLVTSGDKVSSGERLRTGEASQAILVFFEGSRTVLGSNADLALTRVDGDWGKVLRVVLTQHAGKTSHSVVPFKGNSSQFMVFTPSGAGSVHGTNFNVAVGKEGASRFMVNTGKVLVSNHSSQVFLDAGQAVAILADETLDDPSYQFTLQGELTDLQDTSGMVEGNSFTITDETVTVGNPTVGQIVVVEGRILETGEWVADSIEVLEGGDFAGSFTGILEDMEGDEWQIGGRTVTVTEQTDVAAGLVEGSPVRVTFEILGDGSWHALQIELLEEDPVETPTVTPDPEAEPVLVFDPAVLDGFTCGIDFAPTGRLENQGEDPDDFAADIELGYQVIQGAEYVNGVTLNPSGWESLAAGDQAFFGIHVNLEEAGWGAAPAGTQVEVRVFIAGERNRPENHTSYLTVTITASCESTGTPTETGTATETPTATGTATMTETATATDPAAATETATATSTPEPPVTAQPRSGADTACTGAEPHPQGQELASHYGVPYEEIMGWFCQGFGFGEIDRAYGLSRIFNLPVEEIFAMRSSGMGWGQIRKALAAGEDTAPATSPEPDETAEPVETAEPIADEGDVCTGADPHPVGEGLAAQYGVTYEEIMGWFCQGYGFGEIEMAYSWSLTYNVPVADIFAMRSSGMGWGQIRKALSGDSGGSNPGNNGNPANASPDSSSPGNEGGNPGGSPPGNAEGKMNNNGKGKDKGR
jgi:ferric-dicitrate binding protein FerR (iron transport regulator)